MMQTGLMSTFILSLFVTLDTHIAVSIQAAGCPQCGGPLHAAHYQRKPRGHTEPLSPQLTPQLTLRLSWCCARDGCRHRVTTPSIRFWGPLVYTGGIVLALVSAPPRSPDESHLRKDAGCSRQSVQRWRERFDQLWTTFPGRPLVRTIQANVPDRHQVLALLSRWQGRWPSVVATWQVLIHPLTGGRGWKHDGPRFGALNPQKMELTHLLAALQNPAGAL
jgi:hypothetical protein